MVEVRHGGRRYFAPHDIGSLAEIYEARPHATLLAGGTDIGLWVTKQHQDLNTIIYTGNVAELKELRVSATHLVIGGAVSLSDAIPPIVEQYPGLTEMFRRFASPPIRNAGTLGGNIANGSPIGESMPALMVLGATLVLRKGVEQQRHTVIYAGIDKRRAALFHNQMTGVLEWTRVFGIDGDYAIVELCRPRVQLLFGRRLEADERRVVTREQRNIGVGQLRGEARHDRVAAAAIAVLI